MGGQIVIDGEDVMLKPEAVQNLGLALHELATNAQKYGALSSGRGRVRIHWQFCDAAKLKLTWEEQGGPPVRPYQPEGVWRVTCLANYDRWAQLPEDDYQADKQRWFAEVQRSARRFMPAGVGEAALLAATVTTDMFTPRTITKFTGHFNGAIYGAPVKSRQGRTALGNLYLCGTDQGFLGIVGDNLRFQIGDLLQLPARRIGDCLVPDIDQ